MTSFFGCFHEPGYSIDKTSPFVKSFSPSSQFLSFPTLTLISDPSSAVATVESVTAVIYGHPRWRDSSSQKRGNLYSIAYSIADKFRALGSEIPHYLTGSFSLAVFDQETQTGLIAIDRMGIQSLSYACFDGGIVFGRPGQIIQLPQISPEINPQALFAYFYFHMIPAPLSIYKQINKLLPGQFLSFTQGKKELNFYWRPIFKNSALSKSELTQRLRTTLLNSVNANATEPDTTGTFLSGGLDSSTITGLFKQLHPKQATAFSIGFNAKGYDEMEYARACAHHFNVPLVEYYVTPGDVVEAIPKIASSYDEPFGNASAVPTYYCARLAKDHGKTCLLAGDGGDELFAGNARYTKQKLFQLYHHIPLGLRSILLEPLVESLANLKIPGTNKLYSYIEQAKIPMPERMETYNFLRRTPLSQIFEPDFLTSINHGWPIEHLQEVYNRPKKASMLKQMLWLDWKITLADNDLRKVNQMCSLAGIDVTYPMLDDSVVELASSIPDQFLMRGFELRSFYRKAFADFLSPVTLRKSKHGFGLPFGMWLNTNSELQEMAYASLEHSSLNGVIQKQYIKNLKKSHQSEHATYYGVMIWILMMWTQWCDTRFEYSMSEV
ncbi:MAG TPA: asparagine synthase [Methylothermaceae bacterium]|nr:asparagine synthase [Methylothermaceae bacterium]